MCDLVTCGEGDRTRQRVCGDGTEEPGACPGEAIEYEPCNPGKNSTLYQIYNTFHLLNFLVFRKTLRKVIIKVVV